MDSRHSSSEATSAVRFCAIGRVFGVKNALVYVGSIIILGTLVGWFFGNFIM